MKKIFVVIILFVLLWAFPAGAWNVAMMGSSSETVVTYPDITFYWGCETDTAEKSAGDSSATYESSAALSTDWHPVGSKSLSIPGSLDYATFTWSADILPLASARVGFYFKYDTWVNLGQLFSIYVDDENKMNLHLNYTNQLELRIETNNTSNNIGGAAGMSSGTTYFIEIAWDIAAPFAAVYVDGVEIASETNSLGSGWVGTPTNIEFGNNVAKAEAIYLDQILISTDKTRSLYALRNLTSF